MGLCAIALGHGGAQAQALSVSEQPRLGWSVAGYVGGMMDNTAEDLVMPSTWSFDSYHFAGIAVGYERPIRNSKWSVGVEF